MRYRIAAALLLFFCGAVLVVAGAGYACYAIYAVFVPHVGNAYAAAIAAAILLMLPVFGMALLSYRARRSRLAGRDRAAATQNPVTPTPDNVALGFLAGLAREKPVTAVLLAGLFGAALALFRDRK